MKPVLSIFVLVVLSPLFIYMSCKNTGASRNCEEAICTMEFRSLNVQIKDNAGNPVKFDEVFTLRVNTGERIRYDINTNPDGSYTVLDDSYQKKLSQSTAEFRFVAIKAGKELVNELYVISADCCHISKVSGKEEVVVP